MRAENRLITPSRSSRMRRSKRVPWHLPGDSFVFFVEMGEGRAPSPSKQCSQGGSTRVVLEIDGVG